MTESTSSNISPATNQDYREPSVISIDSSDGENQDTDQDAPHELDEEYTIPQGHALTPLAAYLNKGKQRARSSENSEDGEIYRDQDDMMLDGYYSVADQNENGAASQGEINEWARVQLEKLDTDIEAANIKIQDLNEKKRKAEDRAADSRTRWRLGHAEKKMGEYQLEKILKVATGAEASIKKTNDELLRVQERLTRLRDQRDEVEYDTVRKFIAAREKHRPRKPRKLGNRRHSPEYNLDSGDDSLSDAIRHQEEKEKLERIKKGLPPTRKADRACRRCKLSKQACSYVPGFATCDKCAIAGLRCRYKENFQGDRQIRPWLIHNQTDEVDALKAELAEFREKSAVSVGAENPLSGITGYGPPTQKLARQNWALMVRGHPPRPLLRDPTPTDHSNSILAKRKSPTDSSDAEPLQPAKRQRQAIADPSKPYSFQNETVETLAGPSSRGRKLIRASSTRTTGPRQQTVVTSPKENDTSAYPFTFGYPPQESNNPTQPPTVGQSQGIAVNVSNTKLWWVQTISDRGRQLPPNALYMPDWPPWESNERKAMTMVQFVVCRWDADSFRERELFGG